MFTVGNIVLGGGGNYSKSVGKRTSKGERPKTFATDCSSRKKNTNPNFKELLI